MLVMTCLLCYRDFMFVMFVIFLYCICDGSSGSSSSCSSCAHVKAGFWLRFKSGILVTLVTLFRTNVELIVGHFVYSNVVSIVDYEYI